MSNVFAVRVLHNFVYQIFQKLYFYIQGQNKGVMNCIFYY